MNKQAVFASAPMTGTVSAGAYTPAAAVSGLQVKTETDTKIGFHFAWTPRASGIAPSGSIVVYSGFVSGALLPDPDVPAFTVSGSNGPYIVELPSVCATLFQAVYTHVTGSGDLSGSAWLKGPR